MSARRVTILTAVALLLCACSQKPPPELSRVGAITSKHVAPPPKLTIAPLTDELRDKGFSECNPYDPIDLGPYSFYERVSLGRMLIPQKGGHTADMGYDVVIHFNGADAVRKLLVQTAGGVSLVLVDKGSGKSYSHAFGTPQMFPLLRRSIEAALRRHSKDERAHIRHLAISAWSAGGIAVDKLLKQKQDGIDAVIILDGLHGAWKYGKKHEQSIDSDDPRFVSHEIDWAKRARAGQTLFVLTHSEVDPVVFPSTTTTAASLLNELSLKEEPVASPGGEAYAQLSGVDDHGLHVWGFRGNDEKAHCAQLFNMPRIVTEILEPAWHTPALDRSVAPTKLEPWQK